jgi:hypothetical protein
MPKVKCPHCGHVQEWYSHILLCNNCYEDISGSAGWRETKQDARTEKTDSPVTAVRAFGTSMRESLRTGRWLSPLGTILKRTLIRICSRFATLYLLAFLSLSFFMLIGLFTSMIGATMYFPEAVSPVPHMLPIMVTGIAACLFVSLFSQAALISALCDEQAGIMGSLAMATKRFVPYTALTLVLCLIVWCGFILMYLPGVVALVLFTFSPMILIAEKETVFGAMAKNVRYVSGMWLPVLLRFVPLVLFIIVTLAIYAYGGSYLLFRTLVLGTESEFLYVFLVSAFLSPLIVVLAVYVFTVYEDLRNAWGGLTPKPVDGSVPAPTPVVDAVPAGAALSPLSRYLSVAWALYARRFGTLMLLNMVSYVPHLLHLSLLVAGLLVWTHLTDMLDTRGEYGFLLLGMILSMNPLLMLSLIAGLIVYVLAYLGAAVFSFYLYIVLELAIVYAVADEGTSAREALTKARKRFSRYVWVQIWTDLTISTGWLFLVPGAVFMAWYSLTPYVFALEGEEQVAFSKSRRYVTGRLLAVMKRLLSFAFLPVMTIAAVLLIIFALLPFYWMSGMFLWVFSGANLPGMLVIYGPFFWRSLNVILVLGTALFYVPFQKVLVYVLYRDITEGKDHASGN